MPELAIMKVLDRRGKEKVRALVEGHGRRRNTHLTLYKEAPIAGQTSARANVTGMRAVSKLT